MEKLIFFVFLPFFTETTQLEDPRQEWRAIQEAMLREYLQTAQDALEVSSFFLQIINIFIIIIIKAIKSDNFNQELLKKFKQKLFL